MGLGVLGEPMQEQKLLVLFRDERSLFGFWSEGICVLVRASAVPVFKDLPGAGKYAPLF